MADSVNACSEQPELYKYVTFSDIFTYLCIKYIYILNACTNLSPFTPTESRAGVGPTQSVGINRVQRSFVYNEEVTGNSAHITIEYHTGSRATTNHDIVQ